VNPWLQVALSLAVGVVTASAAFLGVRMTVRGNDRATEQRELAARREEWWRRFTWAAELCLDDAEHKRVAGLTLLATLAQSDLAHREEWLLLDAFQARVLDPVLREEAEHGDR
jgi:hypothetical protein